MYSDAASGFCYINDVVLAIQEMRKSFQRILYIDVDLHHGDAVQDAFYFSDAVFTFSMHRYGDSFFPNTGSQAERGRGRGAGKCFNVPLLEGLSDLSFKQICDQVIQKIYYEFEPEAVVVLAGCDGMADDPLKQWNLTEKSFQYLAEAIKEWHKPTLWLGGGGYSNITAAKCWTAMTATILDRSIDEDIPEQCQCFQEYGPSYTRLIQAGLRMDMNLPDNNYLQRTICGGLAPETTVKDK